MNTLALVPVKGLGSGKGRLAGRLSARDRAALIERMLTDVLAGLLGCAGIDGVWVVSADNRLRLPGCLRIDDAGTGLNAALSHAAVRAAAVAKRIIILAADLPFVRSADIGTLLDAARDHEVVIVPDRHGSGTNALALRPPAVMVPRFGRNSCHLHQEAAQALALTRVVLPLSSLAWDVDFPEDVEALSEARPERYGFLEKTS